MAGRWSVPVWLVQDAKLQRKTQWPTSWQLTTTRDNELDRPRPGWPRPVGFKLRDNAFHLLTFAAAWTVLLILGGVIASLIIGSLPAIRAFGFDFLTTETWNPVTEKFGAMAPVYGTIVTSIIAMTIAVPVGLGIAIFLTELCPYPLRRPIGIAIELLAGIPSIIYGIWGLFVFAPFLQEHVQPGLIAAFADVPVLSSLFAGPPYGIGVLTAGVILAIMVLPIVSAISRDVFETVPAVLKEAAYGVRLHQLGSGSLCRDPLHARRASSAASCWASAARLARPWR